MKKLLLFPSVFVILTMACDLSVVAPSTSTALPQSTHTTVPLVATSTPLSVYATAITATSIPSVTATAFQPSFNGLEVSAGPLSIVLPSDVAMGAHGSQFPRAEGDNVAPWDMTPGHTQIKLEGYLLQDRFSEPQILVYPALDYAEMVPGAFESIRRLDNILYGPDASNLNEPLPGVPFFNAVQVFTSNVQAISFQDGGGVRFLAEYAQYPASANNHDLFYHFQGVTRDGAYYIIAILPITAPLLAETSDPEAVLPPGGIAYPDISSPNADVQAYYASVTDLLNATSPDAFIPSIGQLDALIQSMLIAP